VSATERFFVLIAALVPMAWTSMALADATEVPIKVTAYFGRDSVSITAEADAVLREVVLICGRQSHYKVTAGADTTDAPQETSEDAFDAAEDAFGAAEYMQKVAQRRAQVVASQLVSLGVSPANVSTNVAEVDLGAASDPSNRRATVECSRS
jgi:OmpA family